MKSGKTEEATSEIGLCAVNIRPVLSPTAGSVVPAQACDDTNTEKANPVPTQLARPNDQVQFKLTLLKKAQILRQNNKEILMETAAPFNKLKCYTTAKFNGNMANDDKDCTYVSGPTSTMSDAHELDAQNTIA
jgi:hypothetical protein